MNKTLGQIAYEGYCAESGWKSLVSGAQLPPWSDTKPEIQLAWESAAHEVMMHTKYDPVFNTTEGKQTMNIEAEITEDKAIRRDSDAIIQRVKALPSSRERALTITKLQEAVMWMGMDLKRINEAQPGASPNPYPNSKDPSNTRIEPTADGLKL